ncbi:hypothetical Protein YC6258_02810 [Gynuella sunshinyii YC6258]|uniref:Uncharacterized protein n=1 Tax=Gynuella sunshinyii YC6258 TaxID=1445510 RepID=A0A0C5VNA6_9GAMM|nr:hypothetical Protein YC6258_02810 [Gynuella sunshinyii YC6258]
MTVTTLLAGLSKILGIFYSRLTTGKEIIGAIAASMLQTA